MTRVLEMGPPPEVVSEGERPGPLETTVLPGGLVALDHHPMIDLWRRRGREEHAGDVDGRAPVGARAPGALRGLGDGRGDGAVDVRRLFAPEVPHCHYYHARPYGAIWDQREGLQAQVKLLGITYAIFDSVMPAISGAEGGPESAANVSRYFSEVAALGRLGSLHLAHVTKATRDDDQKVRRASAFGSAFWQNLARIGYFADADDDGTSSTRTVGLYRTKGGVLSKARVHDLALNFTYDDTVEDGTGQIEVTVGNLLDSPTLAARVGYGRRIEALLRGGSQTTPEVAEHLYGDTAPASLDKTRSLLNKLAKAGKVFNIAEGAGGGRGVIGRWAIPTNRTENRT